MPCMHRCTSLTPVMDATVYSPQFFNSVIGILNCTICSRLVVIPEKMAVLHKPQFNAELYLTVVLHESHSRGAATLLYVLQSMKYVCN